MAKIEPIAPQNAPSHLSLASRRWWAKIVETYALEAHHLRLLEAACEAWDRKEQARRTLAEAAPYYQDRTGRTQAHPALAVERESRAAFARLVRELGLDLEAPGEVGRPPSVAPNAWRKGGA